jgi:hypothetical protein
MATIVSAIEARGLPRLLSVTVTADNLERSLGEALAQAVKESRSEKKVRERGKDRDFLTEWNKFQRRATAAGLSTQQMVQREITRQDQIVADDVRELRPASRGFIRVVDCQTHTSQRSARVLHILPFSFSQFTRPLPCKVHPNPNTTH